MKRPRQLGIGAAIALQALVLGGCGVEIVPPSALGKLPFRVYLPTYVPFGWRITGDALVALDSVQFEYQGKRNRTGFLDVVETKVMPREKFEWPKVTRKFYADGTEYFENVTHSDRIAEVWFEKDGYACAVTGVSVSPSLVERSAASIADQL